MTEGAGRGEWVSHAEFDAVIKKLDGIEKKVDEVHAIWKQTQGGITALRWFFLLITPLLAAIVWVKQHIKW